jgi:hypothetical protein
MLPQFPLAHQGKRGEGKINLQQACCCLSKKSGLNLGLQECILISQGFNIENEFFFDLVANGKLYG